MFSSQGRQIKYQPLRPNLCDAVWLAMEFKK